MNPSEVEQIIAQALDNATEQRVLETLRVHRVKLQEASLAISASVARISAAITALEARPFKRLGYGSSQSVFERAARDAMLAEGHPLETHEVVEALSAGGVGLSWKTTSNRLWRAKASGVFEHRVGCGYWPSDVPWPERDPNRVRRPNPTPHTLGVGRQKTLADADVAHAKQWLLEGRTTKEVAALVGVSIGTIYNYFPGGKSALRREYPDAPAFAPRVPAVLKMPRVSDEIRDSIASLHASGKPIRDIARELGIDPTKVWRTLKALDIEPVQQGSV